MTTKSPMRFTHNGRNLEVRAALFGEEWKVRVFEENRRVGLFDYSVQNETYNDALKCGTLGDLVDILMQMAQDDIVAGRAPLTK